MKYWDTSAEKYIILNGEVPLKYKNRILGNGANGIAYMTDNGSVFKEVRVSNDRFKQFITLAKLQSEFFAFPKLVLYKSQRQAYDILGYTMDFVDGNKINELDPQTSFKVIIDAIVRLEEEIILLTREEGLRLFDTNYSNILFNQKKRVLN